MGNHIKNNLIYTILAVGLWVTLLDNLKPAELAFNKLVMLVQINQSFVVSIDNALVSSNSQAMSPFPTS